MNDYFDVFFHQQAIPYTEGTVLYQRDGLAEIIEGCEALYEHAVGERLSTHQKEDLSRRVVSSSVKKYLEIQFFQTQLNWDVLLELLESLFPQFIWTKVIEEVDAHFTTYYCELIPVSIPPINEDIHFNVAASLDQMGYAKADSVSNILEKQLLSVFEEEETSFVSNESVRFPVEMTIQEPSIEETPASEPQIVEEAIVRSEPKIQQQKESHRQALSLVEEENEIRFLKESLKREKASKERVRVAKEKLEYELLAIENTLLVSGLKRFKKYQKSSIEEEDWYKPVHIDLIQYDDLYKKAKFVEQSWRLNRQLVTITEKMTVTKDQWVYERARIEKIKNSVSEMDLRSMMEQCHLINERAKVRPGFLFVKPRVKLYQIDYEQLEKISAFFDIIQTENRLLESVIEQKDAPLPK